MTSTATNVKEENDQYVGVSFKITWLGIQSWGLMGCLLPCLQTQVTQKATLPLHADILQAGRLSPTKQLTITQSTWETVKNKQNTSYFMDFQQFLPIHSLYLLISTIRIGIFGIVVLVYACTNTYTMLMHVFLQM